MPAALSGFDHTRPVARSVMVPLPLSWKSFRPQSEFPRTHGTKNVFSTRSPGLRVRWSARASSPSWLVSGLRCQVSPVM